MAKTPESIEAVTGNPQENKQLELLTDPKGPIEMIEEISKVTNWIDAEGERRHLNYPFDIIRPVVPYDPPRAAPTFTFWQHDNATFPTGSIVYFMYSGGRIKIGFSRGLRTRHQQLATKGPFLPVVLLIVKGTERTEKQYHARFPDERLHGEWFTLSKKMRDFFRARLCPVGRASLKAAEAEFHAYCREQIIPTPTRKTPDLFASAGGGE